MTLQDRAVAAVLDDRAAKRDALIDAAIDRCVEVLDESEPNIDSVDVDGEIVRLSVDELHFKARLIPTPGAPSKKKAVLEFEHKAGSWKRIDSLAELGEIVLQMENAS